jgi:hypothetical protein
MSHSYNKYSRYIWEWREKVRERSSPYPVRRAPSFCVSAYRTMSLACYTSSHHRHLLACDCERPCLLRTLQPLPCARPWPATAPCLLHALWPFRASSKRELTCFAHRHSLPAHDHELASHTAAPSLHATRRRPFVHCTSASLPASRAATPCLWDPPIVGSDA